MDEHTSDPTTYGAIETPTRPVDERTDPGIRKVEVCDAEGNVFGTTNLLGLDPDEPAVIYVIVTETNQPPVTVCVEVDGVNGLEPDTVFVSCAERDVAKGLSLRPDADNQSDVPF